MTEVTSEQCVETFRDGTQFPAVRRLLNDAASLVPQVSVFPSGDSPLPVVFSLYGSASHAEPEHVQYGRFGPDQP